MGRRHRDRQKRVRKRRNTSSSVGQTQVAKTLDRPQPSTGRSWIPVTIAVTLIVLAGFALIAYLREPPSVSGRGPQASAGTPNSAAPVIDRIPCTNEDVTYHVHAFLEIYDRGKSVTVPENTGIVNNSCVYWLHTHDTSGEIHIEEPRKTRLTLGNFFDIWHQPLSRTQAATAHVVFGTQMRVSVDLRPYSGNPRNIVLHPHELITIEVGPPWVKPTIFDFGSD